MKDGRIPVRLPDGQVGSVPIQNLGDAIKSGATVIAQEAHDETRRAYKYGTATQAALAGAEGVARAGTFGAYDWIAKEAGADVEAIRGRKEENPQLAFAGEIGGIAGLAALTGGISLFGEAAQGARLGALAARGAVEGGLFGLGSAMSEEALHNRDLTAEKLLIGIGQGALLGGIAGGALGRFGRGAADDISRIEANAADDVVAATVGTETSGIAARARAMAQQYSDDLAKQSLKGRIRGVDEFNALEATNPNAAKLVPRVIREDLAEAAGKPYEAMLPSDFAAAAKKVAARRGEALDELAATMDSLAVGSERPTFGRVRVVRGHESEEARALESEIARLRKASKEALDAGKVAEANSISRNVHDITEELAKYKKTTYLVGDSPIAKEIAAYGNAIREDLKAGGQSTFNKLARFFERETKALDTATGFESLRKLRIAFDQKAKYTASPLGKPTAESEAFRGMRRIVQRNFEESMEAIAERTGHSASWQTLSREYAAAATVEKVARLGARGEAAIRKFSLGDMLGASTGAIAAGPVGAITGGVVSNYIRRKGDQVGAVLLDRFANQRALGVLGSIWNGVDESVKVAGRAVFGSKAAAKSTKANQEKVANAVRTMAADPEAAEQAIIASLTPVAKANPELAHAMRNKLLTSLNFLASKLPKVERNPMLPNAEPVGKPSAHAIERWTRYVDGVTDPMSAIADVRAGKLSQEKAEAVRATFPAVFEAIKQSAIAEAAAMKKPVDYERQVQLSLLLGIPLNPTMDPKFIRATQTMMQRATQGQIKSLGRSPKIASAWMTETQKP